MSKFEHKEGTFTVFVNEDRKSENHPQFTGTGKINGKEVRVALWPKTSANGNKYLSGKIQEPFKKKTLSEEVSEMTEADLKNELDDEIPF